MAREEVLSAVIMDLFGCYGDVHMEQIKKVFARKVKLRRHACRQA